MNVVRKYQNVGNSCKKCMSSISLSGITCPVLVLPNNTEVKSGDANEHVYNTVIEYRCLKGYELIFGDVSRTCQSSKTWTGDAPVCRGKLVLLK